MSSYWREASTVILAAPSKTAAKLSDLRFDYEVLMLQRSSKLKAFSGNHVFPGGVTCQEDKDLRWRDVFKTIANCDIDEVAQSLGCQSPPPDLFKQREGCIPGNIALRITAIRETFEESGIPLLVRKPNNCSGYSQHSRANIPEFPANELMKWRQRIIEDPETFMEMCIYYNCVPDVWSLIDWIIMLTPVFQKVEQPPKKPRRFDTAFFLCCSDYKPHAQIDGVENIDCRWYTPEKAMVEHQERKIELGMPQISQMLRLYHWHTLSLLHESAKQRASQYGMVRWLPVVIFCTDGDHMYPDQPDEIGVEGPRRIEMTIAETMEPGRPLNRSVTQAGTVKYRCNLPPHLLNGHHGPYDVDALMQRIGKFQKAKV